MDEIYLDVDVQDKDATPGKGYLGVERIIVGIAPSPSRPDHLKNEPFGSKSYSIIKKLSEAFPGLYLTNFKKTVQPFGKKLTVKEQKYWAPLLYHELSLVVLPNKKSRILVLGSEPAKLLCPGFGSMRDSHGTLFYNPQLDCEVIPTYHFAAGMRDPSLKKIIQNDLKRFFTGTFQEPHPYHLGAPLEKMTDEVYLDIETSGLDIFSDEIISVGIKPSIKSPVYIAQKPSVKTLKSIFNLVKDKTLIGHNIPFDLSFLQLASGLPWTSLKTKDTMLAAFVCGEEILGLKHLTAQYTDRPGSHSGGGFEDPQYLAEDVASTEAVGKVFFPRADKQWISQLLYSFAPRIASMRIDGVHIDWNLAEKLAITYKKKIATLEKTLKKYGDINWNSSDQVSKLLLENGVPLTVMTPTGKYSTSEPVLQEFRNGDYPIIDAFFAYKDEVHNLSFIESYAELRGADYRLHPKFNPVGASTGRSSMSDPNLQQVPRVGPIKRLFTSRFQEGYFGLIDLAQAELRVAALLSGDELLAEALMKDDVHRFIASKIYRKPEEEVTSFERKKSKGVTFGLLYGGGATGLAERVGVEVEEVKMIFKEFFGLFPTLNYYINEQKSLAVTTKQSVSPLGRIRDLSKLIEVEGEHSAERKGINTPIQGTANDINFILMDYMFKAIEKNQLHSRVIFGVHDSSAHDVAPNERDFYASLVQDAFRSLGNTPLADFKLWNTLPITGEFLLGHCWAHVDSTNEGYEEVGPSFRYECSSLS